MTPTPPRQGEASANFLATYGSIRVWLNGVEMKDVYSYNMDAGTITRAKYDTDGGLMVEGDEIIMETLTGVVTVESEAKMLASSVGSCNASL